MNLEKYIEETEKSARLISVRSVVQVHLGPPKNILADNNRKYGGVAQLGEHLPCKQGVRSSILLVSTILLNLEKYIEETEKSKEPLKKQF